MWRYVVTSLKAVSGTFTNDTLCCARETARLQQAAHSQLASDPPPARSQANQFPLDPCTRGYWLMLAIGTAPCPHAFAAVPRIVRHDAPSPDKILRARRLGSCPHPCLSPTACPDRDVFRALAGRAAPQDVAIAHRLRLEPSVEPPTSQNESSAAAFLILRRDCYDVRARKVPPPSARNYAIFWVNTKG